MNSVRDPETLLERDDVPVTELQREYDREKYDALERRYNAISGVVMVGVVDDGAVLLQGPEWVTPGGSVLPDEGWVEATANSFEHMTGVEIEIEEPVLFERVHFSVEGDDDTGFSAPTVHFRASLAEGESAFREEPTVADDFDTEPFGEVVFDWFEEMPENPHPNHEDHVRLFFE